MASLHEVLKKHKKEPPKGHSEKHHESQGLNTTKHEEHSSAEETKHIVLKAGDARKLFFDLPSEHKFWLKSGREINNLTQLYESLVEMDEETYKHHVTSARDDFSKWVSDILGDTILARRMKASRTRLGHVEAVRKRIDELRYSGRRIPHPHTKLQPDFSFIKTEKKPQAVFQPAPPGSFRLRGHPLIPDGTFIASSRRLAEDGRYSEIADQQLDMIEAVKRDVEDQSRMMEDLGELRKSYDNLFGEFNAIRNEMVGIKAELHKEREQQKQLDQERVSEMKETVRKLRDKEREILGELKYISKTEEKIAQKNETLMDKEAELEKKENLVLSKEKHYNTLMQKYDHMLREIKGKMDNDEKKIQKLLDVSKREEPVQVNVSAYHGDFLSEKGKDSVKTMLTRSMSDDAHLLEQMQVDDLIKETTMLFTKKHYDKVRKNIEQIKEMLKSKNISKDFKKQAYYNLFELSTELDLK